MISQMILSSEGLVTNVTTVWSLVSVSPFVDEQVVWLGESTLTVLANELFLPTIASRTSSFNLRSRPRWQWMRRWWQEGRRIEESLWDRLMMLSSVRINERKMKSCWEATRARMEEGKLSVEKFMIWWWWYHSCWRSQEWILAYYNFPRSWLLFEDRLCKVSKIKSLLFPSTESWDRKWKIRGRRK